ncbi:hypothetical protein EHQ52_15330 [Leptospira koniambonensis]|uniref:Uncharacterized protein n=1 Tax=Leptospira koniambonensis TaxID=2484950 RepID=A0A4R9J4V8_9LEPT|nr:hypothetical protein [Leptospira koniambonensis]TGL31308.1 hypothetical protein EHQ52_15330 [Leptospira koniambonensis]
MSIETVKQHIFKFSSSRLEDYQENIKELRPDKGYGKFPKNVEIQNLMRDIKANIEDHQIGMRIPEDYASPEQFINYLTKFRKFLITKRVIFSDLGKYYNKKEDKEWDYPAVIAKEMLEECISLLDFALQDEEVVALRSPKFHSFKSYFNSLTMPQASLLGAILVFFTSIFTAVPTYFITKETYQVPTDQEIADKFKEQINVQEGFRKYAYPNMGISFITPDDWRVEDAAATFGGGELYLIKKYDQDNAAIGIRLVIRSVQSRYLNAPEIEMNNQLEVWRKSDKNAGKKDVIISGNYGYLFSYNQPLGGKTLVNVRVYWVRLIPKVKLEIWAHAYSNDLEKDSFWREVDGIVNSVQTIDELIYKKKKIVTQ